jgi:hypothetical protein
MIPIPRRLPRWAAAWLVLQVASLGALVPRDSCATHRQTVSTEQRGCRKTAAAPHCPMRSADGTPCPMHRGSTPSSAAKDTSCSLRGTCSEPMVALAALLWNQGVLTESLDPAPDEGISTVVLSGHQPTVARPDAPDPPPPRA